MYIALQGLGEIWHFLLLINRCQSLQCRHCSFYGHIKIIDELESGTKGVKVGWLGTRVVGLYPTQLGTVDRYAA